MLPLEFDDQGQGEAVVLLPPFPFERRIWSTTAAALAAAGFRALSVDYPGFGASPATSGDLSIAAIADGTAALLDELGLARASLVGLSMGGYVAFAFAATFPSRLRALVLADTRAAADPPAARAGRAAALETIATRGVDAYLAQSLPRLLSPTASPAVLAAMRTFAIEKPDALTAGIAALRDRPDRADDARRIACPTLVLAGSAEQVIPAAEMRTMAETIPGARFVELPSAGHLTNLEAPEMFNRHVVEFLRGLPAPASILPSRGTA
ncbi:MAG TPA: alpha/beta fold hydrolase [Polyangia bacterium]